MFPQAGSGERVDVTLVDINIETGEVSVSVVGRGTRRLADLVDLINSTYSNKVGDMRTNTVHVLVPFY